MYSNSLLVLLNSRIRIVGGRGENEPDQSFNSLHLRSGSTAVRLPVSSRNIKESTGVHVEEQTWVHTDGGETIAMDEVGRVWYITAPLSYPTHDDYRLPPLRKLNHWLEDIYIQLHISLATVQRRSRTFLYRNQFVLGVACPVSCIGSDYVVCIMELSDGWMTYALRGSQQAQSPYTEQAGVKRSTSCCPTVESES